MKYFLCSFMALLFMSHCTAAVLPDSLDGNKKSHRPAVGLVLSGGGAKGFAYIGLLKVIREAGLPVDYIGGSSIGSIIGGLYAIGYDPDSIAAMIGSQNWDDLLKDVADRKFKAYEEKEYSEKTIIRLPIKNRKLTISTSIYQGQEINLLLNHYFSPSYKIRDFHKLPTPFLCIGTDILTGEQVVLDKGYLPMAIRSSMSIPGYFAPNDYNGYYLVDGGVVNNYPVKEVKEMGAQFILGGDVQSGLYKTRDQLNSIMAVIDQITSFPRVEANRVGDSLTDLKINFRMPYGMMDFNNYDSIIAFGERVARSHYGEIKALADSLNAIEYRPLKPCLAQPLDSVYIDSVIIVGKNHMPGSYFGSVFRKEAHAYIKLSTIENNIRTMYGSGFFEKISYELEFKNGRTNLLIDAYEGGPGGVAAGIHYDNDYNVSLVLSAVFRNIMGRNSKLFADLNISQNPRFRVVYLLGFGGKSAVGVSSDFYSFKFNLYEKDIKVNEVNFQDNKGTIFFQYVMKNMILLRTGFDYEYFTLKQDVYVDTTLDRFEHYSGYGTLFASLNIDSRDKPHFARRGVLATLRAEYVMPFTGQWTNDLYSNAGVFYLKYDHYIPLSPKFVLQPGLFGGVIIWDKNLPPLQHIFGFGGLSDRNYVDQQVDFTGLYFIQKYGFYGAAVRLKLQYNLYRKLYLTARTDLGSMVPEVEELVKPANTLFGYGLTAGYESFIGPVELSVMASNLNPGLLFYINIGYRF